MAADAARKSTESSRARGEPAAAEAMRIAIVIFDGFDELDAIGPFEVLQNAVAGGADAVVELVTREPVDRVVGSHGLTVVPHAVLGDHAEGDDIVVVPGGGWLDRADAGAYGEAERGELPTALLRAREGGTTIASVCTGAMLLAAAGITAGRRATTHHSALEARTEVVHERVVDDGDLISAGGVTAGIDLALWLVGREWGRSLADAVARSMEHERWCG